MGLRVRKSIKVASGIKANFGSKSASISVGGKGVHKTYSTTGRDTSSVHLAPGVSYVSYSGSEKKSYVKDHDSTKDQDDENTSNSSDEIPFVPYGEEGHDEYIESIVDKVLAQKVPNKQNKEVKLKPASIVHGPNYKLYKIESIIFAVAAIIFFIIWLSTKSIIAILITVITFVLSSFTWKEKDK